eukprot:8054311-Prorocentrum_lima.AAC.1
MTSSLVGSEMCIRDSPFAALQQHLESCHATLNSALRQNMEEAQKHMQHVVQQALLSALGDVPALLAARQQVAWPAPPGSASNPAL